MPARKAGLSFATSTITSRPVVIESSTDMPSHPLAPEGAPLRTAGAELAAGAAGGFWGALLATPLSTDCRSEAAGSWSGAPIEISPG